MGKLTDKLTDKQKEQMNWVDSHFVEDKDARPSHNPPDKKPPSSKKKLTRGAAKPEQPVDMDIDLHGLTIGEAMAMVEECLQALKKGGQKSLRIIHGVGRNSPNSIAWKLQANLNSIWKNRVAHYFHENNNEGATIVILK